jgi:hypothetical protein
MVLKGVQGLPRQVDDCLGPDQVVDVEGVGVGRVLG